MGRSLHARFKRWDGIEPDTNGEMQKVGSGQQDAQGEWGFLLASNKQGLEVVEDSMACVVPLWERLEKYKKAFLALAAHLAPAPAAAIVAPAQAATNTLARAALNCRANARTSPPSARHWEATTDRTSTGPSRSDEGPCSPTVNSSQVSVICHKWARRAGVAIFVLLELRVQGSGAVSCRCICSQDLKVTKNDGSRG
ncbi:hypothetical protein E4U13_004864 [Claviceps humidiphila]|uniref:Uncharacterized protein n=1 Tax=Claviceps humidiphila TaxID=1294629 RepID=A0A9P7Q8B8_9HYPO|nr:hypothetical protein E4U13_004864 [Claviceps humidiphila]